MVIRHFFKTSSRIFLLGNKFLFRLANFYHFNDTENIKISKYATTKEMKTKGSVQIFKEPN